MKLLNISIIEQFTLPWSDPCWKTSRAKSSPCSKEPPWGSKPTGSAIRLQVIEVRLYDPHSERPQPPFSVVLLAGDALLLPQGIYRLHHPARGALDLFMVPLGPDACGMRYELVFN